MEMSSEGNVSLMIRYLVAVDSIIQRPSLLVFFGDRFYAFLFNSLNLILHIKII
jgi:hypothetical protein